MLSGLPLMVQATIFDNAFFDAFSLFLDGCIPPEVKIGRRDITEVFVIAPVA